MAKAKKEKKQKKEKETEVETPENVQSILGKIKKVVSGKEKIVIEDDKPELAANIEDEEPMELTEVVENQEPSTTAAEAVAAAQQPAETLETPATAPAEAAQAPESSEFVDILKEIDTALEKQYREGELPPETPPQAAPEPVLNANVAQAIPENVPPAPIEVKKEFAPEISQNIMTNQSGTNMAENKPNILSEDIANKSSKAIKNLLDNIPRPDVDSPAFRSAITVEDVVAEMMKPMLKEWLDSNLEAIVRDIVEKEIKKIIPRE